MAKQHHEPLLTPQLRQELDTTIEEYAAQDRAYERRKRWERKARDDRFGEP